MLPIIADEHGFQPERHRVEIYGVCQQCQRKGLG
jgi:Fe2+ or Zn2+ uptake regulation protein